MDVTFLFLLGVASYFIVKSNKTMISNVRGIRNNNWLNIRHVAANQWQGMTGQDDKNFVVFSDPVYSIRAGFRILKSYQNRGLKTLRQMISTFAPSNENDTENYINFVASKSGVNPDKALTDSELVAIMPHMIKMEIGKTVDPNIVEKAWALV